MQKFTNLDSIELPRRRRSKAPKVMLFLMILVVTPPLFEFTKLELAERGLFGIANPVETPILNALSASWETGHGEFREWVTPLIADRTWSPKMVLPIAFFWTGVGVLMLRKGHA
jgi:hypothetical protein